MKYYRPRETDHPPLLSFGCCAMSDAELAAGEWKDNPLVIPEIELERYRQLRHGICIYKIVDGWYATRTDEEFAPYAEQERIAGIRAEISRLKALLAETDWAVIKCADRGLVFAQEYPGYYESRERLRDQINELESSLP